MKSVMSKFPEVLLIDATYNLNNTGCCFVFLVIDSDYCGRITGFALVEKESMGLVNEVILEFCKIHENNVSLVQTVVVDKDFLILKRLKIVIKSIELTLLITLILTARR